MSASNRSPCSHSGASSQISPTRYACGSIARQRRRNSGQNVGSSISAGTSSRQPSMPNESQCSATVIRYSRIRGFSTLSLGSAGMPHQAR